MPIDPLSTLLGMVPEEPPLRRVQRNWTTSIG
jgi:hypothetical protein